MSRQELYEIAFVGLQPGAHDFNFSVGKGFFEEMENSEISEGEVSVKVTMVKEERMMDLHFDLQGMVTVSCDRCLEPVELPVNVSERLIIKLGERYFEESEEIQVIPETDHKVDLKPFIYEFIILSLPVKRIHEEDENGVSRCNPEVLKKLEELSPVKGTDPRWDVLNDLRNELNS